MRVTLCHAAERVLRAVFPCRELCYRVSRDRLDLVTSLETLLELSSLKHECAGVFVPQCSSMHSLKGLSECLGDAVQSSCGYPFRPSCWTTFCGSFDVWSHTTRSHAAGTTGIVR